jgi:long-chain acyl-CoA synthetase
MERLRHEGGDVVALNLALHVAALSGRQMRCYAFTIECELRAAIADWGDAGEIDLVEFFAELTIHTSAACLIGTRFRSEIDTTVPGLFRDYHNDYSKIAVQLAQPAGALPPPWVWRTMSTTAADVHTVLDRVTAPGQAFEVGEKTVDGQRYRGFVHAPATIQDVLAALRGHGDTEFVVFEGRRWTFADFFTAADALAATLQLDLGVQPGDRLAIAMRNCDDWLITFAAAVAVGAVVVPVNSWGSAAELDFTLRNCGATILAADLRRTELSRTTAAALSMWTLFSAVDGELQRSTAEGIVDAPIMSIAEAITNGRGRSYRTAQPAPEDTAMLLYTSGSTGDPKGVLTRHVTAGQVVMNMLLSGAVATELGGPAEKSLSSVNQTTLVTVPLFHSTGLFGGFLLPGMVGQKIVLMRKWDAKKALAIIEEERVAIISSVPAILKDLLTYPRFDEYDTSSLFRASVGGAATPTDLPDLIRAKLGPTAAKGTGYGMTESGTVGSVMSGAVFDLKPLSAGFLSLIVELRTIGSDGQPLPLGSEGEICLRGITVAPGYWELEDASRAAFTVDGWLRTGDLGRLDEDGFVVVTGRIKEIVIRGGENIAPTEIENAAYRHHDVQEAAVFDVPDDAMGEELALVCYRRPGSALSESGLADHLGTLLPAFKVPRYIEVIDEPLLRNASEKIHRRAIRERFLTDRTAAMP